MVETGHRAGKSSEVAALYGAVRSDTAYGVNLRWDAPNLLAVEYLEAKHISCQPSQAEIAGHKIFVVLKDGVRDSSAPSGGMLYNLQRSTSK